MCVKTGIYFMINSPTLHSLIIILFYRRPFTYTSVFNLKGVGLGGLGVTCSLLDPRFSGSNPADVDRFLQDVKILSTSPPGGKL